MSDLSIFGPSIFVIAETRITERAHEPFLPEDAGFEEIATYDQRSSWRLYRCFPPESILSRDWPGITRVPEALESLLQRASKHPRALAIAREKVLEHFFSPERLLVTREKFCHILGVYLGEAMEAPDQEFELVIERYGIDDVW